MSKGMETQRDEAIERMSKENPSYFEDKRAQGFSNLWFSQRRTATVEQKDRVVAALISKFLGLGDEIAQRFEQADYGVYRVVGEKQAAIGVDADFSGFWQEIKRIFPNVYTDKDINFLIEKGGREAVLYFLWQLEDPLAEKSLVLRSLAINAHVYK